MNRLPANPPVPPDLSKLGRRKKAAQISRRDDPDVALRHVLHTALLANRNRKTCLTAPRSSPGATSTIRLRTGDWLDHPLLGKRWDSSVVFSHSATRQEVRCLLSGRLGERKGLGGRTEPRPPALKKRRPAVAQSRCSKRKRFGLSQHRPSDPLRSSWKTLLRPGLRPIVVWEDYPSCSGLQALS